MSNNILKIFNKRNNGATVTINNTTYSGNNIQINGNTVIIDNVIQENSLTGNITVTVNGDVDKVETGSGNVTCKHTGAVQTGSGDIKCGDVAGDVRTGSGDVECGIVGGNIRTGSGDVIHRT